MEAEGEVDFHGMKRKQLQSLCKRHGIPANKSNVEMAKLLTQTLKVNKSSMPQGHGELPKESDSKEVPKKFKKVRFSPKIETREYEPTACKQRGRRKTMVNLNSKKSIQGAESELSGKVNGNPPRTRRSREQKVVNNDADEGVFSVIGTKRGRRAEKEESFGEEKLEFLDKPMVTKEGGRDQAVNGGDKSSRELVRRQLRSGKLIIVESGEGSGGGLVVKNATGKASRKRGNHRGSDGIPKVVLDEASEDNAIDKEDAKAANDLFRLKRNTRKEEGASLLTGESAKTEIIGRNTRSRTKLGGDTYVIANKAETFEVQDEPGKVRQLEEPLKGLGRVGLRQKSTLPLKGVAGETLSDGGVEHEVGVWRSKRNMKRTHSGPMQGVISRRRTRSTDKVAENVSTTESEAEVFDVKERHNMTVQLEESLKAPGRNASSQKPALVDNGGVGSDRAERKKETKKRSRNSDAKVVTKVEASVESRGEVEKAPIGRLTRSRCNTIMLNSTIATVQPEESLKAPVRKASGQKPVLVYNGKVRSERGEVKKETRKRSRNSDTKVVTDVEASVESRREVEKVSVPIGQLRRSRHNTIMLNSTESTDEFEIVGDVEKAGLPKKRRIPVREKATSAVVAKRLAGKPPRRYPQQISESDFETGAGYGNDESKDLGLGKLQTEAFDKVSPVNGFLSGNKLDFAGLKTGIERRELSMGEVMHYKSDVANDHSIEVDRISALEDGVCGAEKTEVENALVKNDLEQVPHDDTQSPAVGEKMVNEGIESTLQVDVDVIVAQIDSNKRNAVSERNSCNVSEASREMCVHRLLDREGTCVTSEEVTDGGENCSADIVPLQLSGIGNKSLPLSAGHSSVDRKTQKPPKHLEDQQLSLTNINAIQRGCALLNETENFLSFTYEVVDASDARITTKTDLSCKDEMDGLDDIQADALSQSSSQELQDTREVETAATNTAYNEVLFQSGDCIDEIDGETKVSFHVNISSVEASPGQKTPTMLPEKLSGDADFDVPISKYHEIVANVVDGNGIIGELDVEQCEALGKESGRAVEAELGDRSGCQKLAVKVNANADSHCTKAICEESEKSVEMMMSHHGDSHIAIREPASCKNMEREPKADDRDQVVREESGCAIEAEQGDHSGCQKVAVMVNDNADSHFTKAICEESEKLVEMIVARHSDSHIAIRETASGKDMERELNTDERDQVVMEETADGTLLFEVHTRGTSEEVVPNLNYSIVASLAPALSKEREFFEGNNIEFRVTMPERIERTHMVMEEEGKDEGADLKPDINDHIDEGKIARMNCGDLCDDICRNGEVAGKESLLETTESLDRQDTENEGTSQPNCPMGSGKVLSDYDSGFLEIIDADCGALPDIISAYCNVFDEISDGVMGSELDLEVEVNALELERSDFIAAESCILTDIVAASTNENVNKVEDDFKLKHTNIDDDRECNIATFPKGTPKGISELTVEKQHQESNNYHNDVSNDANGNTEVGADEAGVAITGKICFESEDCSKWTERALISSQVLDSSRKKTQQNFLEQKLFLDRSTSFGKFGMGSSADIISDLSVFSSHGEKYEAHPRSRPISNQAGGKVMASNDGENSTFKHRIGSAVFTNWEANVIQGIEEQDQAVNSDDASKQNLIKNDSELTVWDKNVEEVDDEDGRNQLGEALLAARNEPVSDGGEMSNGRYNVFAINLEHKIHSQMVGVSRFSINEGISMDPASVGGRMNAALDKHTAELALHDLKIDNIPCPVIQDTCEQGLGTTNEVSTADNAEMGILEDVGVGGTLQQVIPAEASHEMVENTQQETDLICSKQEENISTERIALADLPFSKREITSDAIGGFVTPSYSHYMSSEEGEGTTYDYSGSNSTEHGKIHQQDCESEKAGEATKDGSTDGPSPATNPCDHKDVTLEQPENRDATNEVLMVALKCQAQNQKPCENATETKEAHCLHEIDDVSFKEGVNFEDISVTSTSKCQIGMSVFRATQQHITENNTWELNLLVGEDEQGENEKSNALILQTNFRNEDAGKLHENVNFTEKANVQVEQHRSIGNGMDDHTEVAAHTFFSVSGETNFEDVKGSMNLDCAPLKADSLHECIDRENLEPVNVEHSHLSPRKEIMIEAAEVNAFCNAVSSERIAESDPRNLQEDSFASCCVADVEGAMESSVAVRKLFVSIADQSPEFTNSAIDQYLAARDDQTCQLKLPSPQKVMISNAENESNIVHAKQLNSSVNMKNHRTISDQGTPLKVFNYSAMKENLDSIKRKQTSGNMAAPRTLQKRRALEDLRNN